MQNVYYIDSNFIKENSPQYILSIRYATDGLSFCVHDPYNKLAGFLFSAIQFKKPGHCYCQGKENHGRRRFVKLEIQKSLFSFMQ